MRRVHAGFDAAGGYVAQFGDSITYSMAFWSPIGWDAPDRYLTHDGGLPKTPLHARWRDVIRGARDKGPKYANYSGWRVQQLLESMDEVLQGERPEVAMIMIGTNDISGNHVPPTYADQLTQVVERCLAAHCVPIISTIPPRRGHATAVDEANRIIRELATRKQIPLVDYHAECLRRRPGDTWDGTLISDDGVHPSGGETNDYTPENLRVCGYALRNWLSFLALRQVYFRVLHPLAEPADSETVDPQRVKTDDESHAAVERASHSGGGPAIARVYSPRILSTRVADAYSMRTFAQFGRWRDLTGDALAYEVYKYLVDTHTGLFHMNVVAEGDDGLGEFVQVRDPVKIINVYGYAYCGILGPTMAGICQDMGLGHSRTLVLPAWNHVAAETFYDDDWHYLDLDVRAVFRRADGRLASLEEARQDASLWHDSGPLFFPNDALESTREIYVKTRVERYHGFNQSGHTMDYALRPGERFIRWWQPQGDWWHHLAEYNGQPWLRQLIESPPRGPKPNHRHFTVHNYGNGQLVYEPQLTDAFADFAHGVYDCANVKPTARGLTLQVNGEGFAVFEVRSPYVIVPRVGQLETSDDDCQASIVELSGHNVTLSISRDNGLSWTAVPNKQPSAGEATCTADLTPWVSGSYGYLLKMTLHGRATQAVVKSLKITTWVQVAPASLPALQQGSNKMTLVTGDHYNLNSRVIEVRSRAGHPEQLVKYLVSPPEDYDPARKTDRIHGAVTVRVQPPPGTKIAWFTATGQFRTHQREAARETRNSMAYATAQGDATEPPSNFETIYQAKVPSYTDHWHYNATREVRLNQPAELLFVHYVGDPALNNFAVYAHCLPDVAPTQAPVEITHTWSEQGQLKRHQVTLSESGDYEITVRDVPTNQSVEMAVASARVAE